MYLQSTCKTGPLYEEVAVLIATVVSTLWIAVFAAADFSGWRRLRVMVAAIFYDLISLFLVVAALVIPLSLLLPSYQCYGDRAKVSELVLAASSYRSMVAERAQAQQSLTGAGEGLSIRTEGRVRGGSISADGVISVYSDDPKALVMLSPYWEKAAVEWKCAGFPLEAMPLLCRHFPYPSQ
jgi:type IV pilus assembly protein PilA